jgi:hypothetical protein
MRADATGFDGLSIRRIRKNPSNPRWAFSFCHCQQSGARMQSSRSPLSASLDGPKKEKAERGWGGFNGVRRIVSAESARIRQIRVGLFLFVIVGSPGHECKVAAALFPNL